MNFIYLIILVITINEISGVSVFNSYFTLFGQVIYPTGSQVSIPFDSQLIVELQDISVTDNLATTIAYQTTNAVVFPIIFSISYTTNEITQNHVHVLNAKIINKSHDILFANNKRIEVKLLGIGRTKFIDIPVTPIGQHDYLVPSIKLLEWPELVGEDGYTAVDIIKRQTGYTEVFVVTDGSKITKDLRYDRVCVFVDQNNKVMYIPRTG